MQHLWPALLGVLVVLVLEVTPAKQSGIPWHGHMRELLGMASSQVQTHTMCMLHGNCLWHTQRTPQLLVIYKLPYLGGYPPRRPPTSATSVNIPNKRCREPHVAVSHMRTCSASDGAVAR